MNRPLSSTLRVEQLEDRLTPAGSTIPAGEFNWMQYSPTGELGQLVWEGQTLVYRQRVANSWAEQAVTAAAGYTQASYDTRDQVQKASQSAQLVYTSDGTPHVLFLQSNWIAASNGFQTQVQHYARINGSWQKIETISAPWVSTWGPNNLVAEAGQNNSLHILFAETYNPATGVGNTGSGILWYGSNKSGSWQFDRVADTADLKFDVWFSGGQWAPRFLSMAIDSTNHAHITYCPQFYIAGAFSTVYSELRYATNASGAWRNELVYAPQDGTADAGLGASVAVSPTGQVAIASYYADRYTTGSPVYSKLMYHTRNADGSWTHSDAVTAPDGYVAADGPRFTGFSPQLFFDAAGRANIVFSDEAGQHLPITYANEYSGQIRLATLNNGSWNVQTLFRQTDPLHNQLFYPVAAERNGQITVAGLQAVSTLDGNLNITRTDFSLVDVGAPAGASSPVPVTSPPVVVSPPPPPAPGTPGRVTTGNPASTPSGPVTSVAMAVATDAQPGVTTTVAVYRSDGSLEFTLTPFGTNYSGGARVVRADVTGDGVPDLIVGSGGGIQTRVRIWDGATRQLIFDQVPFADFSGGVVLAAGDLNGDGLADVIIGPDIGGGPRVQVWAGGRLQKLMNDFFGLPYPDFRGGLRLASADVNKDGAADLIVAPGIGGGPRVTLYDGRNLIAGHPTLIVNDFFAFDDSLRYGLYLAAGDVDGDGYADIVVGMGQGGPPRVRIISGADLTYHRGYNAIADFYADNAAEDQGAKVGVTKIDSDNKADVLVGTQGARLSVITGASISASPNPSLSLSFNAFNGVNGGVYVG
jgi:hypothetical protein